MSAFSARLCSLVLNEVFGEVVASLGEKLHQWNGQTLQQLMQLPPRVPRTPEALAVIINHNLVTFKECPKTKRVIYVLNEDRVLSLVKFPRYLVMCKTLFGDEGELVVEELFKIGQCSMSNVIFKAAKRLRLARKDESSINDIVKVLKQKFVELTDCQFLCRVPTPYTAKNPDPDMQILPELENEHVFKVPDINFQSLINAVERSEEEPDYELIDNNNEESKILWQINYERFNREFRDQVIVQAVTRRIDASAGTLMRILLNLMNEHDPWAPTSYEMRYNEIFNRIETGQDRNLKEFHDQYFKVLEEERSRFVSKVGDAGGGQYIVNVKHVYTELAVATIENIVLERYGSKALRIFRVIRQKNHVEEPTLQNLVMIPAKETKHLTYTLMENNFIKLQELRKSQASTMGKTFFLFYVDMPQVARMVMEQCYQAMSNAFTRKNHESNSNLRLLDKHERIESIVANLKSSPEFDSSEELQLQCQEIQDMLSPTERDHLKSTHSQLDQLGRVNGQIDETLFVIKTYLYYQ